MDTSPSPASDSQSLQASQPKHPKGSRARILLTSVFGPYAQDDEFGSRAINPMELYHNQVTRAQGAFSLRMFHRSWGIMMIQANISAPCTRAGFSEARGISPASCASSRYDMVGISSIIVNVKKVARDVPYGARAFAAVGDCAGRPRGRHPRD